MRQLVLASLVLGALSPAAAQQQPFDMSPERPTVEEGAPLQEPPTPVVPFENASSPAAPDPAQGGAALRRQLLPDGGLTLAGEAASRNWAVYLTAAQASSAARLHVGYSNAVVVAPESSRLQVLVNNAVVLDEPVRSAEGTSSLETDVPAALLRAGRNELSLRVRHRHRTDCTMESTYQLWTEVDAERTYLSFANADANTFVGLSDLRALAPSVDGRTHVEIVAPALERNDMTGEILQLAQAIALYANQTNLDFAISSSVEPGSRDVALRVLLGTSEDLASIEGLSISASQGSAAGFQSVAAGGIPTLVVSGRDRSEWAAAIDQILAPVDRTAGTRRDALITESWRTPNAPMIYDRRSLTFAELGIPSEQFSGRRYVRSFTFAIPSDFYAGSYGEARLLLDAAYSPAVLPGSSINVYVNGNIAASMPLTESGGAVLDQLPIKVTMRHFQPGFNELTVEADLLTTQDEACLPGASSDETPRFAMFDSSRFVVPDFGRIGQLPNLAATVGTGYPYGLADEPVAIVIERGNRSSLSAAAGIFARMALAAGRAIPLSAAISTDAARQQDAIFIGAINSVPSGVLTQVGVSEDSRSAWMPPSAMPGGAQIADQTSVEDWRRQIGRRDLRDVEDWFSRTFGITMDMVRFAPADDAPFTPAQDELLMVAQGTNPAGTGVWTVFAAPTEDSLIAGTAALADHRIWDRLSGRVSTIDNDLETVASRPVTTFSFVESQPATFANYRLIAANWLSANILSYSLLLVLACALLGIGTSGLLSRLGRRR